MSAFFKTLFGDLTNLTFVLLVAGAAALMVHFDLAKDAVYAVPAALLLGAGWLARR